MNTKETFLEKLKEKGQSSPAGIHWDKFCKLLKRKSKIDDDEKLLNPLILGGSICSHAVKFERLSEHLDWAIRHECINEAINYLERMPKSRWNCSNGKDWDKVW